MCSEPIADEHQHVVNVAGRQLMCVCRGCYLLFTDTEAELRYRAVPDRYLAFPDFALDRRAWEALQIPVGLAFFFHNSTLGRTVAFYPGPGRRHANPSWTCTRGTPSAPPTHGWTPSPTTSRRCWCGCPTTKQLVRSAIWSPSTPATSSSAGCACCGEASTAAKMSASYIDEFFEHARRPQPGGGSRMTVTSRFAVLDVAPEPYAVTPVLIARVGIASVGDDPVHAIALRCQVRIEPLRRQYSDDEAAGLIDLFGPRERWADDPTHLPVAALRPRWCRDSPAPPRCTLPLECTYDFEVAAAKYLHALRDGTIPLQFLFSGTIFVKSERGFSVQQVPWDCEDRYDMPVAVWRDLIAAALSRTPAGCG